MKNGAASSNDSSLKDKLPLLTRRRLSLLLMFALLLVAGGVFQALAHYCGIVLHNEDGPLELGSAAMYALALAFALPVFIRKPSALWAAGATMILWALLRELDFQKMFTYRSIESVGFYTRPIASLKEKLLAILALLPFGAAGLYLASRVWREFRSGAWRGALWVDYMACLFALAFCASASEKLFDFVAIEETCELGLALTVCVWVLNARRAAKLQQ